MPELCTSCGSPIANSQVTGIFCDNCHGQQLDTGAGWKRHIQGPAAVGIGAGAVPFFVSFVINSLNVVALACGAIAVLAGLAALPGALKAPAAEKGSRVGLALVALALGGWHILRSGVLG